MVEEELICLSMIANNNNTSKCVIMVAMISRDRVVLLSNIDANS